MDNNVRIRITDEELEFIKRSIGLSYTGRFVVPGVDPKYREINARLCRSIALFAWHKYWFGSGESYAVHQWYTARGAEYQWDVRGMNVKVVGYISEDSAKTLSSYKLSVKKSDIGEETGVWVLAVVVMIDRKKSKEVAAGVYLLGWADSDMLLENAEDRDLAEFPAHSLCMLPPIRHFWTFETNTT